MNFKEMEFIPLLFGNDINVYSVARAFYEEYGVKSYVYGKSEKGTCYKSKIIDYSYVKGADTKEVILGIINNFAKAHSDKKILAIGCGDNYVAAISKNKGNYEPNVIMPYMDIDVLEALQDKERFYNLCDKHGIKYPKTFVVTSENKDKPEIPFKAPFILKPANQIMYYKCHFEGQKKVFRLNSYEELLETLDKTYSAGYTDNMIVQEFIPGDDTYMRVLTSYSDKNGKVKIMVLGHVLLEEHTPYGIGNHAVIITEKDEALMNKFKAFLEDIEFKGFSNFDIKYDDRDGEFKAFEINTRQGRSNFYVTGAGYNVASYFVNDFVYDKEMPLTMADNESLWMVVPKGVAFKYIAPEKYKNKMKQLIKAKKYVNPLFLKCDRGLERMLRLYKTHFGHYVKYKNNTGVH